MATHLSSLPSMWETQTESLAPAFILAQQIRVSQQMEGTSVYVLPLAFQINSSIAKKEQN